MELSYGPISRQITMRLDLSAMADRDKAQLFAALVEEAKLGKAVLKEPFDEVYSLLVNNFWGRG